MNTAKLNEIVWLLHYFSPNINPTKELVSSLNAQLNNLPQINPLLIRSGKIGRLFLRALEPWLRVYSRTWKIRLDIVSSLIETSPNGSILFYNMPQSIHKSSISFYFFLIIELIILLFVLVCSYFFRPKDKKWSQTS